MDHSDIMGMITSPSSWEQVIFDVVAWEGLDPWNVDILKLSNGFLKYLHSLKEVNFNIPAKFVMVSAILLRMKSDHLPLLDYFQEENGEMIEGNDVTGTSEGEQFVIDPLTIPPQRFPTRRIVIGELVDALRKALGTSERRDRRQVEAKGKIQLRTEDVTKRIALLYDRIGMLLSRVKGEEVTFSSVVPEWTRPGVVNTFLPLVYLENQKKVACRQEEIFEEIYIKKAEESIFKEREEASPKHKKDGKNGKSLKSRKGKQKKR